MHRIFYSQYPSASGSCAELRTHGEYEGDDEVMQQGVVNIVIWFSDLLGAVSSNCAIYDPDGPRFCGGSPLSGENCCGCLESITEALLLKKQFGRQGHWG